MAKIIIKTKNKDALWASLLCLGFATILSTGFWADNKTAYLAFIVGISFFGSIVALIDFFTGGKKFEVNAKELKDEEVD